MTRRVQLAGALALLLAAAPTARAQDADREDAATKAYAAWRDTPFTCHDLIAADAGRDDSTDASTNYDAIANWIKNFPKLAERRDNVNAAELQQSVLKWCTDPVLAGRGNPPLADVVEKSWRLMGY